MRTRRGRSKAGPGGIVLLAVACLGVGGLAGMLLAPPKPPESLQAGQAPRTAPVSAADLDDARMAPWSAEMTAGAELLSPRSGTITASRCSLEDGIASGDAPFDVDERPVVALATAAPLWRDMASGDQGQDVTALQQELVRLGHQVDVTGRYGPATAQAVTAFFRDRGITDSEGTVSLTDLLLLEVPKVTVATCANPRQLVGAGEPLAVTAPRLASLFLVSSPEGLVPGDRVARLDDLTAPVEDGRVTDQEFLAAVESAETFAAVLEDPAVTVDLAYELASPLATWIVPAGSLWAVNGRAACLTAGGVVYPVGIVASAFGSTHVTLPPEVSLTTVDLPAAGKTAGTCG
jgi:peptidoglycan hydrolase-like protein with peptidoglycan-binding domain